MDTSIAFGQGRRRRRIHSAEFKAHIVAACSKPGVSSASVAMANGINANLVRRWVKEAEFGAEIEAGSTAGRPEKMEPAAPSAPKFLPLSLPTPVSAPVL
jgi:transposase